MSRFIHSQTGVVVNVADAKDGRFAAAPWRPYDGTDGAPPEKPAAAATSRPARPAKRGSKANTTPTEQ
ncbi:hypothetical protein [Micromonospora sp. NPDC005652]|uniref:hypothetical protein n=1 Tax=Micromonospora sp. NPDC005652 TaxID=3157046 RepID=UPI0033DA44E0